MLNVQAVAVRPLPDLQGVSGSGLLVALEHDPKAAPEPAQVMVHEYGLVVVLGKKEVAVE